MRTISIVDSNPPKFNAAFLDRRMREHREWQEQATADLATEVVSEVAAALEYVEQVRARRKDLRKSFCGDLMLQRKGER